MFLANNRSAFQHPEFVSQATCELLENDCIIEHSTPPFCANPFSVAEGKKLVFVIDLRHVNNFLVSGFKFKSEDLRSLSQVLEEGRWFFTWDLRSGYHHIYVCVEHQPISVFLGVSMACRDILLLQFCLLALVALVFVSPNCCDP